MEKPEVTEEGPYRGKGSDDFGTYIYLTGRRHDRATGEARERETSVDVLLPVVSSRLSIAELGL